MSKTAIVTGASSGIGQAVALMLCREGYEVYGLGRDFHNDPVLDEHFHACVCDLLKTDELHNILNAIPQDDLRVLVNNAGVAYYGRHEKLTPVHIAEIIRLDLEVPMLLSNALLPPLIKNKGYIINIGSVSALSESTHAAAYGAAKAGLQHFSRTLFAENRKYGLKVCTILPDLTATNLYRNAEFTVSDEEEAHLLPEDVSEAVRFVLRARKGVVCQTITLRPQINKIIKKR